MLSMRPAAAVVALLVGLATATAASAAPRPYSGYLIFKDLRPTAVTEIRDKATGRVVASVKSKAKSHGEAACEDPSFEFAGPRWKQFEPYVVNVASTPSYIDPAETLADPIAAHRAWETPFTTDCRQPKGKSTYRAIFGATTNRNASLVETLESDGVNAVAFQSFADTVCDGATACVVIDFKGSKIIEADMGLERDLTRYGFADFWTTDDRTWFDNVGGRWAVSDVGTHEWGHFAGLGHVDESPELTMFPSVHDGAQTLGLGDMKGQLARY